MLVSVALLATNDGKLRAAAPDLCNCDLTGSTEQELLPKLRLAIEAELTRLLLAGAPLPYSRDGQPHPEFDDRSAPGAALRWLHIHINVAHLKALARHQVGR